MNCIIENKKQHVSNLIRCILMNLICYLSFDAKNLQTALKLVIGLRLKIQKRKALANQVDVPTCLLFRFQLPIFPLSTYCTGS